MATKDEEQDKIKDLEERVNGLQTADDDPGFLTEQT